MSQSSPAEGSAAADSVPGVREHLQEPEKGLFDDVWTLTKDHTPVSEQLEKAKKEIEELGIMLAREQGGSSGQIARPKTAITQINSLRAQVKELQMKSQEADLNRLKLNEAIRQQTQERQKFGKTIREQNRNGIDSAYRHAELQNQIAELTSELSMWRMLRGVPERERKRLLNVHASALEARNRDSGLKIEKASRVIEQQDDEWEAGVIEKEPPEEVIEEEDDELWSL